jgi:superfamily II DNA/RNA helicase
MLVQEMGIEVFRNTSSAKMEALLGYLDVVVKGQGSKAVVFTFFGQSVLRDIQANLTKSGYKVYINHGGMSISQQQESRTSFKSDPQPAIFLTSDAGSRGINLPEATYVIEYESALTFANRTQRLDRIHRIDSKAPSVTCMTMFLNDTVEDIIAENMIQRNDQTDILLGDNDAGENHISAAERKTAYWEKHENFDLNSAAIVFRAAKKVEIRG